MGTDSTTEAEREAIWRAHRLAEGLRSLANMVATTTDPEILSDFEFALGTIIIPVDGRETLAAYTRAGLAAGAKIEKYYSDSYAGVRLVFGPVSVRPYDSRDKVCERVVTGTKEVTKQVADPEWVTEVPTVTVTETVEVVEWNCDSFLKPTPLDLPILTPFVPPTQPFAAPERTKTPPPPVGGPSHPDGPAIPGMPSIEDDAWDDHADKVPLPHPVFKGRTTYATFGYEDPALMEHIEDGHKYMCCGKVGRISRHEAWCPAVTE